MLIPFILLLKFLPEPLVINGYEYRPRVSDSPLSG